MVGMPCALAFAATAAPDSLVIDAMTSTLTPLEIMPSARVENFCSSPCAFWMSGARPSACMACWSSGLSKPSQRAELSVSGRITPTLMASAAGAAADCCPPPLLGAAVFCPQAASTIVRPRPAAHTAAVLLVAVVLVRILVLPTSSGSRGGMLRRTTYGLSRRGANHSELFKKTLFVTMRSRHPRFVAAVRSTTALSGHRGGSARGRFPSRREILRTGTTLGSQVGLGITISRSQRDGADDGGDAQGLARG